MVITRWIKVGVKGKNVLKFIVKLFVKFWMTSPQYWGFYLQGLCSMMSLSSVIAVGEINLRRPRGPKRSVCAASLTAVTFPTCSPTRLADWCEVDWGGVHEQTHCDLCNGEGDEWAYAKLGLSCRRCAFRSAQTGLGRAAVVPRSALCFHLHFHP